MLQGCELTQTRQEQRLSVAVDNPSTRCNLQGHRCPICRELVGKPGERRVDPGKRLLAAEQLEALVEARGDRLSGQRDADRHVEHPRLRALLLACGGEGGMDLLSPPRRNPGE